MIVRIVFVQPYENHVGKVIVNIDSNLNLQVLYHKFFLFFFAVNMFANFSVTGKKHLIVFRCTNTVKFQYNH